jgi:DNA-3-methyladenine glycosylase I
LEGAQSGLSWLTILRKRQAYRRVFQDFDIDKVAAMTEADVERILQENDPDPKNMVVRHRGKIEATINNAKCIQSMRDENKNNNADNEKDGALDAFLWGFVDDKPILNRWNGIMDAPSKSEESEAMGKALKKLGFRFVGPTTCYAMMQSVGMVIDHPVDSPEWKAAYERLQSRPGGFQERT